MLGTMPGAAHQSAHQSRTSDCGSLHASCGPSDGASSRPPDRESAANRPMALNNGGGGIRTLVGGISPETVFEYAAFKALHHETLALGQAFGPVTGAVPPAGECQGE